MCTHNNNKTLSFCKIMKANRMCFLLSQSVDLSAKLCILGLQIWKHIKPEGAFTPDANKLNKLRYSRVVGRLNILSFLTSFAREIRFISAWNLLHSRVKFTTQQSSIVVLDFLPPLVITSLLEQAPDWLTQREYPPKLRFFNWKRPKRSIRAA